MPGHNGGAKGRFFLEHRGRWPTTWNAEMDALGWDTAHIVGNSLGGWVAFELERRGRARTLTGIAPAGGWTPLHPQPSSRSSAKFVAGHPAVAAHAGPRPARAAACRSVASVGLPADQRVSRRPERRGPARHHRRRLALPGVLPAAGEGATAAGPGWIWPRAARRRTWSSARRIGSLPHPRFTRHFTTPSAVGHPGHSSRRRRSHPDVRGARSRVADLIVDFVDRYATPPTDRGDRLRRCRAPS